MNGKNNFNPNKISIKDFKNMNKAEPSKFGRADCILLYKENGKNRVFNNYSNISNEKYRKILEDHKIALEDPSENSR